MIRRFLLIALAFASLAACQLPSAHQATAAPAIPSARCADEVASALTGVTAVPQEIATCFSPEGQAAYTITSKADFDAFLARNSSPSFYMGHGCGEYAGDKFGADFLKGLYVYAYAVTINPSSFPTVFAHSILAIGEDKAGLVTVVAHLNNSPTECPFGKAGATPGATPA